MRKFKKPIIEDAVTLQKAIEKAMANGYKPGGMLESWIKGDMGFGMDANLYNHLIQDNNYFQYIYCREFAESLWGDESLPDEQGLELQNWEYYLQQMVIEKEPLKYLKKFI